MIIKPTTVTNINSNIKLRITYSAIERFKLISCKHSKLCIFAFIFEFIFVTVVGLIITSLSAFMPQLAVIIISACLFILPSALYMIDNYFVKSMINKILKLI